MSGWFRSVVFSCAWFAAGAASTAAQALDPPAGGALFELDRVWVSVASRLPGDARTRAVSVLDRVAIEALAATSVSEALRWMVGVDLLPRSAAQADVALRGGTSEQVLVLVDGLPMSDAQTGHFDLDLAIPLSRVERIEVLRGAASSVHGADAMGGVINIVTRAPTSALEGSLQLEGGTFGRAAGTVALAGGRGRWAGALSARFDRSDGHRAGTDHEIGQGDLRLAGPLAGGLLSLRMGLATRDFGADGFYAPFPSYEETRTRTLSGQWQRRVGTTRVEVAVHGREHDDDFVLRRGDPAFYRNVHQSRQTGVDLTLRSDGGGRWGWATGVTGGRDDLESTNLGARTADRGAWFGEGGWTGARARLRGGLRLDAHEGFAPAWAPSISAGWSATSRVGLRAAVARSFRTPTWTDRFYEDPANRGDPDLAVETAWSTEAGLDWTPSGGGLVRLTAFVREARDLIDYARPAGGADDAVWQTRNVESASFRGLELEVHEIDAGPMTLGASLELLDVSSNEAGAYVSKYALRPLTRTAMMSARLPLSHWLSLALRVENRKRTDQGDWTASDLRIEVRRGSSRLWFDATNLGDAHWLDVSGRPGPGRAFRTGLSVDFGGRGPDR